MILLFLEDSVGLGSLRHTITGSHQYPAAVAPKQGNRRNMIVRTKFMLGIICDQVLIQASEMARRLMNFFRKPTGILWQNAAQ